MLTGLLVLLAVVVVFAAGEAVRGQCRRMLRRPPVQPATSATPTRGNSSGSAIAAA